MATLSAGTVTLVDHAKLLDPDGGIATVAEILDQQNDFVKLLPFKEGNLPTGHRITQRAGLPTAYYRKMNQGTPKSKATTHQMDETCGELTALCDVDVSIANLNGNTAEFRMNQSRPFFEALNQRFMRALLYANVAQNGEEIQGLAPRYSDKSAPNGVNIIEAGGTGSGNTSIWLLGLSDHTIYGAFPKGSKAGLEFNAGSEPVWARDQNGDEYKVYRDDYKWHNGLVVEDWRYGVRIANIDVAALKKDASTGADLVDLITQALEQIHSLDGVRPVLLANRTVTSMLRRQANQAVKNSTLSIETLFGRPFLHVGEVPVIRTDALLNTEARVV